MRRLAAVMVSAPFQDLGSKNGTFVGDEKILGSNTVTLANGMYITLGNEIFQFKI